MEIITTDLTPEIINLCRFVEAEDNDEFLKELFDILELTFRDGSQMGFKLSKYGRKDLIKLRDIYQEELEKKFKKN